jgi:hypothetical protein
LPRSCSNLSTARKQPDVSLLDEIHEGEALARVLLRDVHDESEVSPDELVPGVLEGDLVDPDLGKRGGLRGVRPLGCVVHELAEEHFEVGQGPCGPALGTVLVSGQDDLAARRR